jgi:hypothetical protein
MSLTLYYIVVFIFGVMDIVVLVRMFKARATALAIVGIFVAIIPFIWGWVNVKKENLWAVMVIMTAPIVLIAILVLVSPPVAPVSSLEPALALRFLA